MSLNESAINEVVFIKKQLKNRGVSFEEYILLIQHRNILVIHENLLTVINKLDEIEYLK